MYNIYLPENLISPLYKYDFLDNGNILIYTGEHCNGWVIDEQYEFHYVVNTTNHYNYTKTCGPAFREGDVNLGTKINTLSGNILLTSENFTSELWYRNDFDSILFIFLILFIFVILIPYKIFSRIFGRWLKV